MGQPILVIAVEVFYALDGDLQRTLDALDVIRIFGTHLFIQLVARQLVNGRPHLIRIALYGFDHAGEYEREFDSLAHGRLASSPIHGGGRSAMRRLDGSRQGHRIGTGRWLGIRQGLLKVRGREISGAKDRIALQIGATPSLFHPCNAQPPAGRFLS